ncbi:vitamin K-dependent protein C [Electrophorus electricus]|uniref:vitamin K-dependent protein C n=1 Tax=Electrophorus electricus TaxID=8005 RepID=UPI0015D060E8|nr:vitamin K-dependent protein C [Electrophorus electricus]
MAGKAFLCFSVLILLWAATALSMSVFYSSPKAHMLLRSRRANSFLEELKPPSKERECVEERCDFEEAREIFHTREATLEFWTVYEGSTASNCSVNNGGCHHDCYERNDRHGRYCTCIQGYQIHENSRECLPKSAQSCGQILTAKSSFATKRIVGLQPWLVGGEIGRKGESPWQALILNYKGHFHCGGVLIDERWVLTAAHCLERSLRFSIRLGDYLRFKHEGTEETIPVTNAIPHPNYNPMTADNDIALLHLNSPVKFNTYILPACLPSRSLAERVLHLNGTQTVVTGWGRENETTNRYSAALNYITIPLVDPTECARHMTNNITQNVLCAGMLKVMKDACHGDSGGPMMTQYHNTWFLIGLVSWGEGCGRTDKLGIYTKVSNYLEWIESIVLGP